MPQQTTASIFATLRLHIATTRPAHSSVHAMLAIKMMILQRIVRAPTSMNA
jgi:hypothetical protein